MNKTTRKEIIINLLLENWNRCHYCNKKLIRSEITIDHITPYCEVWDNTDFVLCCFVCNNLKWNISKELYEDWYICVNYKKWLNIQSENKPLKLRNKINFFEKHFPSIFKWNKKYKITYKNYE